MQPILLLLSSIMYLKSSTPNSTLETEVSWQTCFWVIIILAINNMAQPSGRICDSPIHHRIFIRASPLICILDMFFLPIQLISDLVSQNISFRTSLQLLLRRRFDDSSVQKSAYSKALRWLRWLFFIIGVLPQAIRLASFKNTPCTKIIGLIFLSHFIVGEVLIFLSSWMPMPTFDPILKEDDGSKLHGWSSGAAFFGSLFFPPFLALQQLLIFVIGTDSAAILAALFLLAVLLPSFLIFVLLCIFAVGSGLDKITKFIAGRYPEVVRRLMLAVETDTGVVKVDEDAVWLLGLLVINLVYCVLGYRFVYDSSGTVDPGWIRIFS